MGFTPSKEDLDRVETKMKANFAHLGPFNLAVEREYAIVQGGYYDTGLILVHFYTKDIILRTLWGTDFSVRRLGYFDVNQMNQVIDAALKARKKT